MIGRRLNLPVKSVPAGEAAEAHFGWMSRFFSLDMASSSALTREQLGWQPTRPDLLADIDREEYFAG